MSGVILLKCQTWNLGIPSGTEEDPLQIREGRDLYDSLFPRKGTKPLFGFLIFVGGETMSSLGFEEGDLGISVFFD
jgi:hypothetical protein